MQAQTVGEPTSGLRNPATWWRSDLAALLYLALATVLVHLLTGNRYGFQRDELATLEDARRLAWGYVAYPPVTPFFGRISLMLFGTSLVGFRFFAFVAEALAVLLTGLMARALGGGRGAQMLAAAAAVPFSLAGGAMMQYVSFDYLFWVLTAYCTLRLLRDDDPRWWLGIGAAVGLGMMSKYAMLFFVAGLLAGLLLTPARTYLRNGWLWLGLAVALLIFLPNLLWQIHHHFISLAFLRHIHARDVRMGRTRTFLPDQFKLTLLAAPLWMAGLYFYLFSRDGRRWRALGWMYVAPLLLFVAVKGRSYYLAAAYPMLYAGGAVWGERWLAHLHRGWRVGLRAAAWTALALDILLLGAVTLPIAPVRSAWAHAAFKINGDFAECIGWPELVETVALIRDKLPQEERAHLGVLAGNYGEAGALHLYGPRYGLPAAISGVNSFWARGYGSPPPATLIILGFNRDFVARRFTRCEVAARTWNLYGVENEETRDHPEIFVCSGLRESWPQFWNELQSFG